MVERADQSAVQENGITVEDSSPKEPLWLLNVLRGISALLIMLYHYTTQYDLSIGHIQPYCVSVPWGCYAVDTFFLLSGFLTVYAYDEKTTAWGFIKKRFLRLYPMFWICMLVTTMYMMFLMPDRAPSIKQFIINLTMVPSFFHVEAVDGVYWTLAKELMFYFGFAAIVLFGLIRRKNAAWLWAWMGLDIVCICIFPSRWIVSILLIPEYLYAFLAGAAVFYLNRRESPKGKGVMIVFLAICLVLCSKHRAWDGVLFFALSIFALILCSKEGINQKLKRKKWMFKPLLFLSEISYVLYLTHQFIGFGVIKKMEAQGLIAEVWVLLPVVHAIFLAAILHYGVEIRINQRIKILAKRIKVTTFPVG